jgi:hypothetical protein
MRHSDRGRLFSIARAPGTEKRPRKRTIRFSIVGDPADGLF